MYGTRCDPQYTTHGYRASAKCKEDLFIAITTSDGEMSRIRRCMTRVAGGLSGSQAHERLPAGTEVSKERRGSSLALLLPDILGRPAIFALPHLAPLPFALQITLRLQQRAGCLQFCVTF